MANVISRFSGVSESNQEIADGGIQSFAVHSLAYGLGVPNSGAHAHVGRDLARFVHVIAHRHPIAASATDHQPLQERRSFSGWARAPFGTVTLCRLVQL